MPCCEVANANVYSVANALYLTTLHLRWWLRITPGDVPILWQFRLSVSCGCPRIVLDMACMVFGVFAITSSRSAPAFFLFFSFSSSSSSPPSTSSSSSSSTSYSPSPPPLPHTPPCLSIWNCCTAVQIFMSCQHQQMHISV